MNKKTVARYALAGVLMYMSGAIPAYMERGYFAMGGEALFLLLPVAYHPISQTIRDLMRKEDGHGTDQAV